MNMFFSPIIENAIRLSSYWHHGQMKSDGVFEFVTHPMAVGMILSRAGFDDEIVAAGICHELLSHTDCPKEEILNVTSERVLYLLEPLVNGKTYRRKQSWKQIKSVVLKDLKPSPWETKAILVADRIHVIRGLMEALREQGL